MLTRLCACIQRCLQALDQPTDPIAALLAAALEASYRDADWPGLMVMGPAWDASPATRRQPERDHDTDK